MNSLDVDYKTERIKIKWLDHFYGDRYAWHKGWQVKVMNNYSRTINGILVRAVINEWILRRNYYQSFIQWLPLELMEMLEELIKTIIWCRK